MKIISKRLYLTPFSDLYITQEYISWLNDESIVRYSEQRHSSHTYESCLEYLKSFNNTPNFFWAIEESMQGYGHIGNITAYVDIFNNTADVGILIGRTDLHGKGYGTEAFKAAINFLFCEKKIRKITAGTMSVNHAMINVMKKSGMKDDGVRKRQCIFNGQEVDIVHMAIFLEEYDSNV